MADTIRSMAEHRASYIAERMKKDMLVTLSDHIFIPQDEKVEVVDRLLLDAMFHVEHLLTEMYLDR